MVERALDAAGRTQFEGRYPDLHRDRRQLIELRRSVANDRARRHEPDRARPADHLCGGARGAGRAQHVRARQRDLRRAEGRAGAPAAARRPAGPAGAGRRPARLQAGPGSRYRAPAALRSARRGGRAGARARARPARPGAGAVRGAPARPRSRRAPDGPAWRTPPAGVQKPDVWRVRPAPVVLRRSARPPRRQEGAGPQARAAQARTGQEAGAAAGHAAPGRRSRRSAARRAGALRRAGAVVRLGRRVPRQPLDGVAARPGRARRDPGAAAGGARRRAAVLARLPPAAAPGDGRRGPDRAGPADPAVRRPRRGRDRARPRRHPRRRPARRRLVRDGRAGRARARLLRPRGRHPADHRRVGRRRHRPPAQRGGRDRPRRPRRHARARLDSAPRLPAPRAATPGDCTARQGDGRRAPSITSETPPFDGGDRVPRPVRARCARDHRRRAGPGTGAGGARPQPEAATFEEPSEEFDEPLALPRPDTPYRLPDASSLVISTPQLRSATGEERVATQLLEALGHHGIEARLVGTVAGPRVTRYEIQLAPGTKVGKVESLQKDLAYALATTEIRILAPIPGKQAVGVEVPEPEPERRHARRRQRRLPARRRARSRSGSARTSPARTCTATSRRCRTS